MNIVSISSEPILEIPFLNAGKGQGSFYIDRLPVMIAIVDTLPANLDAIIATADLQGRQRFEESTGGPPRLLGEMLPTRLSEEILPNLGIDAERTGILLAGDFYTVPGLDQRGGSGDVTRVWEAFGREFRWVAGVAGNHDMFGEELHPKPPSSGNRHYLDGRHQSIDGLTIAGLGGIIGNPRRPHRRTDQAFVASLEELLSEPADVVVMHDGPDVPQSRLRGSPMIRLALEQLRPPLVVRGHAHWNQPLVELSGGTKVLNVDCCVVIMCRGD